MGESPTSPMTTVAKFGLVSRAWLAIIHVFEEQNDQSLLVVLTDTIVLGTSMKICGGRDPKAFKFFSSTDCIADNIPIDKNRVFMGYRNLRYFLGSPRFVTQRKWHLHTYSQNHEKL
jgi:hypothetical protein